jgi:hypothetical protein
MPPNLVFKSLNFMAFPLRGARLIKTMRKSRASAGRAGAPGGGLCLSGIGKNRRAEAATARRHRRFLFLFQRIPPWRGHCF